MDSLCLQLDAPLAQKARQEMENHLSQLRTEMKEEVYASVWKQGSAMTLDQALLYLQQPDDGNATVSGDSSG